jgi:predicted nucleic acid-binding protein
MKYIFDSSAIFRAIKENKIEILAENYTVELARYELGNILWKDCGLQAKISEEEAKKLAKAIRQTLNLMDVTKVQGHEEEILETAVHFKITFYDAAYAYLAKARDLKLITEDSRLIKKVMSEINASTLDSTS